MVFQLVKKLIGLGLATPVVPLQRFLYWCRIRRILKQARIDLVLDVGANKGQFASDLRAIGYKGKILSFEPIAENFEILSTRFAHDHFWKGYNFALGAEAGYSKFGVSRYESQMSSFREPLCDFLEMEPREVQVQTLDHICADIIDFSEHRTLLKLDTQGYNLEVVRGGEKSLSSVSALVAELALKPIYKDMPGYLESLAWYEKLGFKLVEFSPVARDKDSGELIECDGIFLRDHLTNSEISPQSLEI